jgi:hypothetical protein
MKTLHLAIISFIMIIFLGFGMESVYADNASDVYIQDIKVQPSPVQFGETFTVSATLANNSTFQIAVDGGKCSVEDTQAELFTITLDNHVKNKAENIYCAGVGWSPLLDPGKSITGTTDYTTDYVATEPGTAAITVTFSYHSIIQTNPIQTSAEQTVSKSFQFQVHGVNETYAQKPPVYFGSPLEQFKSGIPPEDIKCNQPLILFFKVEDSSPVCLTGSAAEKLSQRKWLNDSSPLYAHIVLNETKEFVLSSPTFNTFGINKSLFLDNEFTCILTMPEHCLDQAFFEATRPGYGNGTNSLSPTNQIIHHNVAIRIYNTNQVECAVIDGIWDEKNQKPLGKNDEFCGFLFGFKGGFP